MTRRIVHYTDDARSPVNGTEGINDVWQGFRYDFCLLLSEMERTDLSRDAKSALCTELQCLLSDMSCGVEKMSDYVDFMAGWQEGFAVLPVKENPVKKRRGKSETAESGTAEELFPDAVPGENAVKETPTDGASEVLGFPSGEETSDETCPGEAAEEGTQISDEPEAEGAENDLSADTHPGEAAETQDSENGEEDGSEGESETVPGEDAAEGTDVSDKSVNEDGTNLGEDAEKEDSDGGDGAVQDGSDGAGKNVPGEDALKGEESGSEDSHDETASGLGVIVDNTPFATEDEVAQTRFTAEHGSEDDEGEGKEKAPLIKTITDIYGGDEKDGGAEGTISPDNETEEK